MPRGSGEHRQGGTSITSITIGTRGSTLALWQTEHIANKLRTLWPDCEFVIKKIKTQGDRVLDVPLAKVGSQGLFVKEIENALLSGEIDLGVHSLKDMPSQLTAGLEFGAISQREDPRDVLVSRLGVTLAALPPGARVGTSSPRRSAQLLALRPDLTIADLRGNLDTRLRKAMAEDYDAMVLAAAGIKRLGFQDRIVEYLPLDRCLPAVGQGALAVEIRQGDSRIARLVGPLDASDVHVAVTAERAFMRALGGGCQAPVGSYGLVQDGELWLRGVVAALDGRRVVRVELRGDAAEPELLGARLANVAISQGAKEILEEAKGMTR